MGNQITDLDKFYWVGTIETYTGKAVNVIDMKPSMVDIVDISHALSMICRYNGHIPTFYSVAEHSVRVAKALERQGCEPLVCLTGLLHDASETYVGDMVRPLKRAPGIGSEHQRIEDQVSRAIFAKLGGIYPYPPEIHKADEDAYRWEVANIRTGKVKGWSPKRARMEFLQLFIRMRKLCLLDETCYG